MSIRKFRGSIWPPLAKVWFRCPHSGLRQVTVLRQLKTGMVWIADSYVAKGAQKVHPSLLSAIKP